MSGKAIFKLDAKRFVLTLVGALFTISGIVLQNSSQQLKESGYEDEESISVMAGFGPVLYIMGWGLMVYSIAYKSNGFINSKVFTKDNYRGMIALISGITIIICSMVMGSYMSMGEPVPMALPIILSIGWLGVGYSAAMDKANDFFSLHIGKGIFALVGVGSVLFSLLYVLPFWDRPNDITDGFGMPLLTLTGWGGIILANSIMGSEYDE